MTSLVIIAVGIVLLVVSLATSRADYLLASWGAFLAGSILVIVGTGKLFFLDGR